MSGDNLFKRASISSLGKRENDRKDYRMYISEYDFKILLGYFFFSEDYQFVSFVNFLYDIN